MGTFRYTIEIGSADQARFVRLEALLDELNRELV